jgi:hypothetical protein
MTKKGKTKATTTPVPNIPGLHIPPGRKPAEKRPRQDTPSPNKVTSPAKAIPADIKDWHVRVEGDLDYAKSAIGTAVLKIKTDTLTNLGSSISDLFTETMVGILIRNSNTTSDLCSALIEAKVENGQLKGKLTKVEEELEQAKMCRTKVEAKASKKDMEDKVKVASTQFKVMNLDLGGAITDRKELTEAARKALEAKVRTDLRTAYDEKIKAASIRVLASKPFKRQAEAGEIWTAPVLVTIDDQNTRWQVEDTLRKSKVFPSFHWPQEMVDNVKAYRQVIGKMGFVDDNYYIRIRPEQRDGTWRIRADAKSKAEDSTGRFFPVAAFDLPPLDPALRSVCDSWLRPIWVSRFVTASAEAEAESDMDSSLTTEDIIYNL